MREQCIERLDVLDKVKKLFLLPQIEMMTTQQVAEYYEVGNDAVQKCYQRNKAEIDGDGVVQKTSKDILELIGRDVQLAKTTGYTEILLAENLSLRIPHRGVKLFSKRAVLRIGMLLRDSEIAKEVRTQLLNTFEHTEDKNKTADIDDEQELLLNLAKSFATGDPTNIMISSQALYMFQKRHIEKLAEENEDIKTTNKMLLADIVTWSDRASLNRAVRTASNLSNTRYGAMWNELYEELYYKNQIALKQRAAKQAKKTRPIACIHEDEWPAVQQALCGVIMNHGLDVADVLKRSKMYDKVTASAVQ